MSTMSIIVSRIYAASETTRGANNCNSESELITMPAPSNASLPLRGLHRRNHTDAASAAPFVFKIRHYSVPEEDRVRATTTRLESKFGPRSALLDTPESSLLPTRYVVVA